MPSTLRCRVCGSNRLLSVLDLGAAPPCELLLEADALDSPELTFPLNLRLCENCLLLQLPALIAPADTFTEYAYFSSYSDSWVEHARTSGYLLRHVVDEGVRCLGIEPSVNVGAAADLVVANNVYAHLPDFLGFTNGLRTLLADDGWLSFEVHHALNLVALAQFDTIYPWMLWEHVEELVSP